MEKILMLLVMALVILAFVLLVLVVFDFADSFMITNLLCEGEIP